MHNTGLLTALQLCGRGTQFILFFIISVRHGVDSHTDIVFLTYAPVAAILAAASGIADTVLIPAVHLNGGVFYAGSLYKTIFKTALLISTLTATASVTCFTFYTHISPYAATLLVITAIIGCQAHIYSGILNGGGFFYRVAASPIFGALCGVLTTTSLPPSDINLAATFAAYEIGRYIFLLKSFRFLDANTDLKNPNISQWISRNSLFQAMASVCSGAVPMIHLSFATQLGHGFVTNVEYANRYWQIAPLLFSAIILTGFQKISQQAINQDFNFQQINHSAFKLGCFGLLAGIVLALCYTIILPILYSSSLHPQDIKTITSLAFIMLTATGPYIASMIYLRVFAVLGRHEVILFSSILNIITSTTLDYILTPILGIYAIAISTTASQIIMCCFICIRLHAITRTL